MTRKHRNTGATQTMNMRRMALILNKQLSFYNILIFTKNQVDATASLLMECLFHLKIYILPTSIHFSIYVKFCSGNKWNGSVGRFCGRDD